MGLPEKRRLWLLAQGALSAVLLVWLLKGFDWPRFWALGREIPAWLYLGSLGVVMMGQVLYAWKWYLIVRRMGMPVPFGRLSEQYFIGLFFNNFLPTTVGGDWARIYYLGQGWGYTKIAASVVMDRVLGVFALTALSASLAWVVGFSFVAFTVARQVLTVMLAMFGIALAVALTAPVERLAAALPLSGKRLALVRDAVVRFAIQARAAMVSPSLLLAVMGIVLTYACLVALVYCEFFRIAGADRLPFTAVLTTVMMIAVFANVPITVNGIGLREQLHYLLFASVGLPKETVVGVSLLMFGNALMVSLVGWALWIRYRRERRGPRATNGPAATVP